MVAIDFSQDKLALIRVGLLQGNPHEALVHDLKTDPVIMARCDCADSNAAAGTPLGLSNVLKVLAGKGVDKSPQHSDWSMTNDLTMHQRDYGAFHAYVIRHVKMLADQGPVWTGDVSEYLSHLSTCRVFRNLLSQRHQSLQDIQDGDMMERDINAYHEEREHGDLQLQFLDNG